jgi:class 3 adenylate cyclase
MATTRRLAATLAADVAGYSRLMEADEEGTHERLQACLRDLVNPKIGKHRGRVVKTTGDRLLAEFVSVVEAMRCAAKFSSKWQSVTPALVKIRYPWCGPAFAGQGRILAGSSRAWR